MFSVLNSSSLEYSELCLIVYSSSQLLGSYIEGVWVADMMTFCLPEETEAYKLCYMAFDIELQFAFDFFWVEPC